ncbi:MAG: hypothetical protein LBT54_03380, partial [Bifidobacteriaceae bacterium]|nr:hypothetical protein [Bifidobacteriaceae bacterium]
MPLSHASRRSRAAALALVCVLGLIPGAAQFAPAPAIAVSNHPSLPAMRTSAFHAYVKAGERVDAYSSLATLRVTDPLGNTTTGNSIRAGVEVDGIWTITIERGASDTAYTWRVNILDGDIIQPGRLWFTVYSTRQTVGADLSYWAVNSNGYMYLIDLDNFNGVYGRLAADAVGVPKPGTCIPSYRSREFAGLTMEGHFPAIQDCGSGFKIFFEEPDPTLPESAQIAPGQTDWIIPPPVTRESIKVTDFSFAPTTVKSSAGTFTYSMAGFAGNYLLQIDVDANGSYTDAVDRAIELGGSAVTDATVDFDGVDGLGSPIPDSTLMMARIWFERTGEMHLVMDDVESRPGIRVTRLNGPDTPDHTIYWDDSALTTRNRSTVTPVLDGSAGVDSSSFVHEWAGTGSYPWGDERRIDDWVYGPFLNHTGAEIPLGVVGATSVKAATPSTGSAVLPGQEVEYRLSFTADPRVETDLDTTDDMSGLLDDADLIGGPRITPAGLNVSAVGSDGIVRIDGAIPKGETVTVAYTARVRAFDAGGDHVLANVLLCDEREDDCVPRITNHPVAKLTLSHTATVPGGMLTAGANATLVHTVTNTGLAPLDSIAIVQTGFTGPGGAPSISCPPGVLEPEQTTVCTGAYTVTQADIDAGSITSTAHATGLSVPSGADPALEVSSNTGTASLTSQRAPALGLSKSVGGMDPARPQIGQALDYNFTITNTGNVTVHAVEVVEDSFSGAGALPPVACPVGAGDLAPGQSVVCSASYTVTQADVDAGFVDNAAHAVGTTPISAPVLSSPDSARFTFAKNPSLSLAKTSSISDPAQFTVGRSVLFSYSVVNTGNVTISDLEIVETEFTGSGSLPDAQCDHSVLAPGATALCTTSHTITQDDVDAGQIANAALARGIAPPTAGQPPAAPVESPEARAVSPGVRTPALHLDKSVTGFDPAAPAVGQRLTYRFSVTNTGNVSERTVRIAERGFSGTGASPQPDCSAAPARLYPGETAECTAVYTVTQADQDAGTLNNTAAAQATDPAGATTTSADDSVTLPLEQHAALSLDKSVSGLDAGAPLVGQQLQYAFVIANTGDVTVSNAAVAEDRFTGSGQSPPISCAAGASSLAPGASVVCQAAYRVTQADVDAGFVANTAHAVGSAPSGAAVVSAQDSAQIDFTREPGLSLTKTSSVTDPSQFTLGAAVTFSYSVVNSGNVTVDGLAIREGEFTGSGPLPAASCGAAVLAPGASTLCTAVYSITQDDVDAGRISNVAVATGRAPDGSAVESGPAGAVSLGAILPALTVDKTVTGFDASAPAVGQRLQYRFAVANTGNVSLRGVAINDAAFSGSAGLGPIDCSTIPVRLLPSASAVCTAPYTVTQADLDAGVLDNTATARATDPAGAAVVSEPDSVSLALPQHPGLVLVKSVSGLDAGAPLVGQELEYAFVLRNAGDVTLSGVGVVED